MDNVAAVDRRVPWVYKGKPFYITRPNFETERDMQQYLEEYALATLNRHKARLGQEAYQTALSQWTRDCTANVYGWGKPCFLEAVNDLQNPVHLKKMLLFTLRQVEDQKRLSEKDFEAMWADDAAGLLLAFNQLKESDKGADADFTTPPSGAA